MVDASADGHFAVNLREPASNGPGLPQEIAALEANLTRAEENSDEISRGPDRNRRSRHKRYPTDQAMHRHAVARVVLVARAHSQLKRVCCRKRAIRGLEVEGVPRMAGCRIRFYSPTSIDKAERGLLFGRPPHGWVFFRSTPGEFVGPGSSRI